MKRFLLASVNIILILTGPIWFGTFMLGVACVSFFRREEVFLDLLRGKSFLFNSFL